MVMLGVLAQLTSHEQQKTTAKYCQKRIKKLLLLSTP